MPNPTIARVQRLVPAAAAADEADLAGDGRIGAHDVDRVDLHAHEVGMRQAEPGDRFVDDALRIVDDLLHGHPFNVAAARRATVHRRRRSTPSQPTPDGGSVVRASANRRPLSTKSCAPIPRRLRPEYGGQCSAPGRGPWASERMEGQRGQSRHIVPLRTRGNGDAGPPRLRRRRQRRPREDEGLQRRIPHGQRSAGASRSSPASSSPTLRARTSTRRSRSASSRTARRSSATQASA